jgi:cobalt/nickel transport system permease protein
VHAHSRIHALPPQCKVLATFLFVVAVVSTPREVFWSFALYSVFLLAVARFAQVPPLFVVRRVVLEAPFVVFALFLPLLGPEPRVDFLGLSLSTEGLWAAWNILAKATLAVAATTLLAATTTIAEMLHGLEHLRMPKLVTAIAGFMVRYADVVIGEALRMKVARDSRAYDPRWFWQARALAASLGTLFIRSYERGERVYLAMVSRGYAGALPIGTEHSASTAQWATALVLPAGAAAVAFVSWLIR